jgi:hypothetical protein
MSAHPRRALVGIAVSAMVVLGGCAAEVNFITYQVDDASPAEGLSPQEVEPVDVLVPVRTPADDPEPIAGGGEDEEESPTDLLDDLPIVEIAPNLPEYERNAWQHWTDDDSDCQNTRAEVLIGESGAAVTFRSSDDCTVDTGEWFDPYTNQTFTEAGDLDVDHMVPLKNAHISGAHAWDDVTRRAYANELANADQLIAVSASANRSKGARGPDAWRPTASEYWCEYATHWVSIKLRWELSVTAAEFEALEEMLETC